LSDCESDCHHDRHRQGRQWYALADCEKVATITPSTIYRRPSSDGGKLRRKPCVPRAARFPDPCRRTTRRIGPVRRTAVSERCGRLLVPRGLLPDRDRGQSGISFVAKSGHRRLRRQSRDAANDTTPYPATQVETLFHEDVSVRAGRSPVYARAAKELRCSLRIRSVPQHRVAAVRRLLRGPDRPAWERIGASTMEGYRAAMGMQQPPGADESIPFDVWLDDVKWTTDEQLGSAALDGLPATSGCVPLDNGD